MYQTTVTCVMIGCLVLPMASVGHPKRLKVHSESYDYTFEVSAKVEPEVTFCQLQSFAGIEAQPTSLPMPATASVFLDDPVAPVRRSSNQLSVWWRNALVRKSSEDPYVPAGEYRLRLAIVDCPQGASSTIPSGDVRLIFVYSEPFRLLKDTLYEANKTGTRQGEESVR